MELLSLMSCLQMLVLCQASQNVSASNQQNDSLSQWSHEQHANQTILYAPRLSGECSGTLGVFHAERWLGVMLPLASRETAAAKTCENLGCGEMYNVSETPAPKGRSVLTGCTYWGGHLENCTLEEWRNSTGVTEIVCGNRVIRLSDGGDRCAGRVELWSAGRWGTVCDDGWDLQAGHVACSQMRCGYALKVMGQGGPYVSGSGPIQLDDVNCTGTERSLWNCPAMRHSQDCGHKEDAGVICSEMRALRLTGGLDRCSGKVEIHRNGSWGTMSENGWGMQEASMVCSMLDCGVPMKFTAFEKYLSHNNATKWYYHCKNSDTYLWQCKEYADNPYLCKSTYPAMLICNESLGLLPISTPIPPYTDLSWSTAPPTPTALPGIMFFGLSPALWGCFALSLILVAVLIANVVLCSWYRKKYTFTVHPRIDKPQTHPDAQQNDYRDTLDIIRIASDVSEYDEPPIHRPMLHQSSMDTSSLEPDYEYHDPSAQTVVPMSTFQNSLRNKEDWRNPAMNTSNLYSLTESGPVDQYNLIPEESCSQAVNQNVIPSEDSFDSSSTSSEECYENTGNSNLPLLVEANPVPSEVSQNGLSVLPLQEESTSLSGGCYRNSAGENDYDDVTSYWH